MNEKTKSIVRQVATFIGGILVAKGWASSDIDWTEVGGALATIGSVIFSLVKSHKLDKEKLA